MNTIDPREQGALQAAAAAEQLRRQFTQAMRGFASAVTVITVAHGGQRSGYTATSVSSFCAEPPTVLVSTTETSSSAALITGSGRYAVNLLGPGHKAVAQRFTGFGGETGEQRYAGADWLQLSPGGAPVLRAKAFHGATSGPAVHSASAAVRRQARRRVISAGRTAYSGA